MKQIHDINYINKRQLATLNNLLKKIMRTNLFYQTKYSMFYKKAASGALNQQDFFMLPFLSKDELVSDQLTRPPYGTNLTYSQEKYLFVKPTSGTSGKPPFKIPNTQDDLGKRISSFGNGYKDILRTKRGDRILNHLASNTSLYHVQMLSRAGYKVFSIEDQVEPQEIIDKILFHDIESLQTTCTKVFALMKYVRKNKIDPRSLPLNKIIHIGEGYLSNNTARKLVKKYLNSECFESVGSTECGGFGKECTFHNGSHFIKDGSIFEVINPNTFAHDTKGELVITTLWRSGYPLIRYRTGDYVEIDTAACPCGYKSSRIILGSIRKYKDSFSVNGCKSFSSMEFDELIRKYIGINDYFVKITKNKTIIKIEREFITEKQTKQIINVFSKRLNTKIVIKLIDNVEKIVSNKWKFNRIYDARTAKNPGLFIRLIAKITSNLQNYIDKRGPLHPW